MLKRSTGRKPRTPFAKLCNIPQYPILPIHHINADFDAEPEAYDGVFDYGYE